MQTTSGLSLEQCTLSGGGAHGQKLYLQPDGHRFVRAVMLEPVLRSSSRCQSCFVTAAGPGRGNCLFLLAWPLFPGLGLCAVQVPEGGSTKKTLKPSPVSPSTEKRQK